MKTCTKCGETLPLERFSPNKRSGARKSYCKPCQASVMRQRRLEFPEAIKAAERRRHLKRTYGLTPEEYDRLLTVQGGVCRICSQPERRRYAGRLMLMTVDHDHQTGAVRGLLCYACNSALGLFGEDPERLLAAVAYLRG